MAFRDIVEATKHRLYRLALRMTGNAEDARDVLQDSYVRAHGALVGGRWKGESTVDTWLYRIVVNTALNHRRGWLRRARPVEIDPVTSPSPETSADAARLMREVFDLPSEQRAVVVLKELEGHTSAEIGRLLECSEGAVEQRLLRARATLRKRLGDE